VPAPETVSVPLSVYKVVRGDTLGGIARKQKISLSALTKANPDLDPAKLMPGKTLKVPMAPASAAAPTTVTATMGAARPAGATVTAGTYKVKPGDNLTKIARANGITVGQLRAANNIKTSQIQVGQTLKIPARSAADSAATTQH
jgi:LysM repeat protein